MPGHACSKDMGEMHNWTSSVAVKPQVQYSTTRSGPTGPRCLRKSKSGACLSERERIGTQTAALAERPPFVISLAWMLISTQGVVS